MEENKQGLGATEEKTIIVDGPIDATFPEVDEAKNAAVNDFNNADARFSGGFDPAFDEATKHLNEVRNLQISKFAHDIRGLREKLDFHFKAVDFQKRSAESTLAFRSLQMAKAWLGKSLEYLGEVNPYTPSPTIDGIPATADTAKLENIDYATTAEAYLSFLNITREAIEGIIQKDLESLATQAYVLKVNGRVLYSFDNCITKLIEAKMWLGFELQNLRENKITFEK